MASPGGDCACGIPKSPSVKTVGGFWRVGPNVLALLVECARPGSVPGATSNPEVCPASIGGHLITMNRGPYRVMLIASQGQSPFMLADTAAHRPRWHGPTSTLRRAKPASATRSPYSGKTFSTLSAMAGDKEALPFSKSESVARRTPRIRAIAKTLNPKSSRASIRIKVPGCEGVIPISILSLLISGSPPDSCARFHDPVPRK